MALAGLHGSKWTDYDADTITPLGGKGVRVEGTTTFAGAVVATGDLKVERVGVEDTDASHHLMIACGSNLGADRVLSLVTGDAARTITLSGNPTLSDWFDQSVKAAASPTFAGLTLTGHLLFTDNTYDIGASGATRPRSVYLAAQVYARGTLNYSLPEYSFGTDPDTGVAWRSADSFALVCGGAEYFRLAAGETRHVSANLTIGAATKGILFNSADNTGGSNDTGIHRNAAGVLEVNSGVKGTFRDLILRAIEIDGDLNHDGTNVGFYGTAPIAKQTGVAVDAAGIHAALVALGLISA